MTINKIFFLSLCLLMLFACGEIAPTCVCFPGCSDPDIRTLPHMPVVALHQTPFYLGQNLKEIQAMKLNIEDTRDNSKRIIPFSEACSGNREMVGNEKTISLTINHQSYRVYIWTHFIFNDSLLQYCAISYELPQHIPLKHIKKKLRKMQKQNKSYQKLRKLYVDELNYGGAYVWMEENSKEFRYEIAYDIDTKYAIPFRPLETGRPLIEER